MYVASSRLYAPFSSLCLLIVVRKTANDGGALVALKNDGPKGTGRHRCCARQTMKENDGY